MSTGQRIGQSAGEGRGFFKSWMKVALVTIIFAVLAMALGNVIWPPAEGGPEPTSGQVSSFIILAVLTALTFGLGISFLLFGFPFVRKVVGGSKLRVWAAYLSIGWLLVSWYDYLIVNYKSWTKVAYFSGESHSLSLMDYPMLNDTEHELVEELAEDMKEIGACSGGTPPGSSEMSWSSTSAPTATSPLSSSTRP